MSLANTLACTVAADALVLLGDPQQLDQPTKGVHPDGVGLSALEHLLGGHKTMPPEQGEFLGVTRRLAPSICDCVGVFLRGSPDAARWPRARVLQGCPEFSGAGLRIVRVEHDGNRNASGEWPKSSASPATCLRQDRVGERRGQARQLTADDILVVAPCSSPVSRLEDALNGVEGNPRRYVLVRSTDFRARRPRW